MSKATKLKWTRHESRYGTITWTSGPYTIERHEYTLPYKSISYSVRKDGVLIDKIDHLADAKCAANEDLHPSEEDT